jgi:Phage integrase family
MYCVDSSAPGESRKAITVPLPDTAVVVLRRQFPKKRKSEHVESMFVYHGKPVDQTVTAAWAKARMQAGIRNSRWHDLRCTWASWHVQRGTPLQVLKEPGGWETLKMVQRDAHLPADHLAQSVHPMMAQAGPPSVAIREAGPAAGDETAENQYGYWCARLGSNQQPLPSEGSTLSIELRALQLKSATKAALKRDREDTRFPAPRPPSGLARPVPSWRTAAASLHRFG